MKQFNSKFMTLLLLLGLNYSGLLAVGQTLAYFNDTEDTGGNIFTAGSLDFSLTDTNFDKSIGLTEKITVGSVLMNSGSLAFQYTAEVEKISGSDDFCNALRLEAELNGIEKHDGLLMAFSNPVETMLGSWTFEIKLPFGASDIPHGDVCEFDFVFQGWQTDMPSYGSGGFSDEERLRVYLTSRMIVLNEFLPRPDGEAYGFDFGDDSSDMPQGEWVEIYNNSAVSQDLSGWYIWDASGSEANKIAITAVNTYPASTIIGGKSWLVVYMNKAVLNNDGDTVKLYNSSDVLIDSYAYTPPPDFCEIEPTPGDENSTSGSGSCVGVPSNKSYARIPDGIGYWVDPIPTPGGMNSLEQVMIPMPMPQIQAGAGLPSSPISEEPEPEPGPILEEETIEELVVTLPEAGGNGETEESVLEEEVLIEPVIEPELTGAELDPVGAEFESVDSFEEIVEEVIETVVEVLNPVELPEEVIIEEEPIVEEEFPAEETESVEPTEPIIEPIEEVVVEEAAEPAAEEEISAIIEEDIVIETINNEENHEE